MNSLAQATDFCLEVAAETTTTPNESAGRRRRELLFMIGTGLLLVFTGNQRAQGQADSNATPAPITTADVVQQLVRHNEGRAERLKYYASQRCYHVEYHGFPVHAEAKMVVEMTYRAPSSKTFRVLSESGSHFLINHVLKKLMKSEVAAARHQNGNALTPENYNFHLIRLEVDNGRTLYVLRVEPKRPRKFLYRGTIWVDSTDFSVVKIEAQPSKKLSFWIRSTKIHHVYTKTGDFWLPEQDRSVTKVRFFGGTAVLTIDYGTYQFASPSATKQPNHGLAR